MNNNTIGKKKKTGNYTKKKYIVMSVCEIVT